MTLITCYDAYDAGMLPGGAKAYMAYQHNLAQVRARFPHAKVFRITTNGAEDELDYDGCDCENGDAGPETAADWAYEKYHAKVGALPWVYVQLANRGQVVDALRARGMVFGEQVWCWVARWLDSAAPPKAIRTGMDDGYSWGTGNMGWQFHRDAPDTFDVSVVLPKWVA